MTAINTAPLKAETGLVGKVVTQELSTTGTTLYVRFEDSKTGVARTPQATTKLFTLDKDNDRFEIIFADSHSTTDGITTITINANGRAVLKYGGLNGGATGNRHPLNAEVGCVDVHTYNGVLADILNGTNPTYAQTFKVGDGTANDIILYFIDNQGTPSFIMKDSGTGKILMSNDGVNTFDPEAGGSGVTAGDGISITGGAVAVDTTDTAVFAKTDGDVAEDKVPVMGATGVIADRAMHATTDISSITATADELNKLDGASANVTATNLNTLTGGPSTDASALHKHSAQTTTYFAYENVTTAKAVAQLPIQCEWFAGLTSTELPLGNTNANRKRSFAFVPSQDVATVPNLSYRVCEAVNGATAVGDMVVRMETDDGTGKPSGTLVHANATYTITQAAQRTAWTATEATATITWAGSFGLTKGTTYHIVFSASGTDATNYIKLFGNATSGEYQNYLVFPQYSYSVDTTAWTAVSNSYLYIWEATVPFGNGVVHTDADYAGRTFSFVGIVRTGVSAYADVEVYENEAPNQTGLICGVPYYISATAGEITTTRPSGLYGAAQAYSIGSATSKTNLKIEKGQKYTRIVIADLNASATNYYKQWFPIKRIFAIATGTQCATSTGIYDTTTQSCYYANASSNSSFSAGVSAKLIYLANVNASTTETASISDPTNATFTLTVGTGGAGVSGVATLEVFG